jgi:hypothetical protein
MRERVFKFSTEARAVRFRSWRFRWNPLASDESMEEENHRPRGGSEKKIEAPTRNKSLKGLVARE